MNDQAAQGQMQTSNSYVDEYVPPTSDAAQTDTPLNNSSSSISSQNTTQLSSDSNSTTQDDSNGSPADEALSGASDSAGSDEDIEAQNIFYMLGVENGEEDKKEKFLDQLQDVIWEDFLTKDVELLLSEDEMVKFKVFKEKSDSTTGDAQEKAKDEMVEFLETLIPDLEDIMLEKALDLKADLFVERINGMKEYFAEKSEKLEMVSQAEQLMYEDKWKSAAKILNSIQE